MNAELLVLAKCEPTYSKDRQNTFYKLTVLQGQEAGQVSCPLDVYNSIKAGDSAVFNMEYNSEFKSLRLLGLAPLPSPAQPGAAASGDGSGGGRNK